MKQRHFYLLIFFLAIMTASPQYLSAGPLSFPNNPLPSDVMNNNPFRNETSYEYKWYESNLLFANATAIANMTAITNYADKVMGFKRGSGWHKSNGWTIGTHGLFNSRRDTKNGYKIKHSGIDMAAPVGTSVLSADSGTVTYHYQDSGEGVWKINWGYGLYAIVKHDSKYTTRYAHLKQFSARKHNNDPVSASDPMIALSGASGSATLDWVKDENNNSIYEVGYQSSLGGPHLHFEVMVNGNAVEPLIYLPDSGPPSAKPVYLKIKPEGGPEITFTENLPQSNEIVIDGPTDIEVGAFFEDDLLVRDIEYKLFHKTGTKTNYFDRKGYSIQKLYDSTVSKDMGTYHYLPEWEGVYLTSNFNGRYVGGSIITPSLRDGNGKLNPDAIPTFDFHVNVTPPGDNPCQNPQVQQDQNSDYYYVSLIIKDIQGNENKIDEFLKIRTRPKDTPSPDCTGDHPDDTFTISSNLMDGGYDIASMSIADVSEANAERLLRLAVKKNKTAVLKTASLLKEMDSLNNEADEYFDSLPELSAEEAMLYDLHGDEISDPVLRRVNSRTYDIAQELKALDAQEEQEFKELPDIAILEGGFAGAFQSFFIAKGQPYALIPIPFSPDIVQNYPVLIIPSGGVLGFEGSSVLKAALDEYVRQGGTVIILAQQHGYEFSILPVPQEEDGTYRRVSGYGWGEDQSCFTNSSYIDTWHHLLAGQGRSTPTLNVDGYFMDFPSNTTVFLRRTKNGQPAMIMYEYGQGRVIATSMYSDWAYGGNQASSEELALIRDMIVWAKAPAELPEAKRGETATITLSMVNESGTDAASVRILVYDPDRSTLLKEQTIGLSIPAGQTSSTSVSYQTGSSSPLGIYHVDYQLLDAEGNVIQPQAETDSGRFAVSSPPVDTYEERDFNVTVNSDSEKYAAGSDAVFTITVWNNSDEDRTVTLRVDSIHIYAHFIEEVTIPANSSITRQATAQNVRHQGWVFARVFKDADYDYSRPDAIAGKGIWTFSPSVDMEVQTDNSYYANGDTVNQTLDITNMQNSAYASTVKVNVADPSNLSIYSTSFDVNLAAGGTLTENLSFDLPPTAASGFYAVTAEAYDTNGNKIGGDSARFEVPSSWISVKPDLSSPLTEGINNIPFVIKNLGWADVSSGVLDIDFRDPEGVVLYSDSLPLALAVGDSKTIDVPVTIASLKFGDYTLTYTQSDETRTGQPSSSVIPNAADVNIALDKTTYKVRETANLTVNIANVGQFNLDNAILTVSAPGVEYTDSQTVQLAANNTALFDHLITIPETASAGRHDVNITLALPSESLITKTVRLTIPASFLEIGYSGPTSVTAGDTINLTVENRGGLDTSYTTEKLYIIDAKGIVIYNGSAAGTVLVGENKTLADIQIHAQTADSVASLYALIKNDNTKSMSALYRTLEISGLTAELEASTDKSTYLASEDITALSTISNGDFDINDGTLDLRIIKYGGAGGGQFEHFLPKDGWMPFLRPSHLATGNDNSIYITDTYDVKSLHKYDSSGNFVNKWSFGQVSDLTLGLDGHMYAIFVVENKIVRFDNNGQIISEWSRPFGSGDGQFYAPYGIAVGQDGSVYLAEPYMHRVQKFDSNGNFLTNWGGNGTGDGQFKYPRDVVVGYDGYVYVVDGSNSRIQKFDSDGNFVAKWGSKGSGDGQLNYPYGIAIDSDGFVYVADGRLQKFDSNGNFIAKFDLEDGIAVSKVAIGSDNMVYMLDVYDTLLKYDRNGNFIAKWENNGSDDGQFEENSPIGISVDLAGSIYVVDSNNYRIQIFDSSGDFVAKWEVDEYPISVAVGADGYTYILGGSWSAPSVQKYDKNGNFLTKWGSRGSGDGQFYSPADIAVDSIGNVYVADRSNYRVQKFDGDGNFLAKWGSRGSGDGQFGYVAGVAVGTDDYVYVVDRGNRVQKFDSEGNFIAKIELIPGEYWTKAVDVAIGPDGSVYVLDDDNYRVLKCDSAGSIVGEWGGYQSGDGQIRYVQDIAVGPDGSVYITEREYSHVQKLILSSGGEETLFETTVPITQAASTIEEYVADIGTLDATGKLYLYAELKNELGQVIAQDSYPFYVVEGNTLLLFNTDKKIYRPGETVSITGEVRNLASIAATGLALNIDQGTETLYDSTFDIPAGGSQPFTATTTASDEGTYNLKGTVTQNGSTLVEILDQYEVANPVVAAMVTAPDVAGNEPFDITVELKNDGKVDASVTLQSSVDSVAHDISIPVGETRALQYSGQITASTTYTFTFTGDLEQTITKAVDYGLSASITVSPEVVYPEGRIAIPVTVLNTGTLDEALDVTYTLQPGGITEQKAYYIPAGTSVSDTLYYELPEGDYTVSAASQLPDSSAQASFSVKKENNVLMAVSVGAQTGGLIPVGVDLTNLGYNAIDGSLRYALSGSEGEAWSGEQAVTGLLSGEARAMSFDINPSALTPGDYTLSVILIDNSGQTIAATSAPLTVLGPVFEITQLPPYQTFQPGQVAEMTFSVRNVGNVEGAVELALSAYDLIDTSQREWLGPNEEKSFTFGFMLPDDLEEKDYFADYKLSDEGGALITSGQVKYHLAGISITVDASLDKQYYLEGETAHLTLNVQSQSAATLPLFARVNYAGYEAEQVFTLDENQTLTFDVPLAEITGEKLFYGIYYESGRSIHLNSLYIHEAGDELTIITDKQVYDPGETVSFTISSEQYSGTLTVSSLDYSATMQLSGSVTDSFTLPAEMTAGTYTIRATLTTDSGEMFTAAYPFDVAGMQVKVLECVNDKGKYALSDTITTSYTISSNTEIPATLKTWIVDPEGRYTPAGEEAITLTSDENLLFTGQTGLQTDIAGIHRLVYGIYRGNLLLVSGSESFDVGDAVLLGLSTDKTDYPTNYEPVVVTASMFGTAGANLELLLDDVPVQSQQVALNGFVNMDIDLGTVEPGVHTLKGILIAGGLKSIKETGFVYGSTLPDLTVRGSYAEGVSKENTMELSFTVTNSGKTPATLSVLTLYRGDEPIETIAVSELQPEESAEHTVNLNVLGKAGEYEITAVADAEESVVEFNEKNNSTSLTVKVPELTLFSSTGLPEYRIREDADIIADITNLSAEAINSYRLRTVVTSPLGTIAFEEVADMPELTAETLTTVITVWSIPDSAEEGTHEILQQVLNANGEVVEASSASVEVLASDFILSIEPVSVDLRQGEDAVVSGSIEPLGIFDSEVSLQVDGLPEGASHVLNPCTVAVPGEFALKVLTNQETVAGTYQIKITAEGDDIIHEAVFDVSISAFELKAQTDTADIEQLESASFALDINSLNGYEGDVTLDISGVPHGMKASFGQEDVAVPDRVTLNVLTSKYAKPGEYVLTVSASDELVTHSQELTVKVLANPVIAKGIIVTQGSGPKNEAWVRALGTDFSPVTEIMAFDTKYGAYAASADIDGDGYDEIIAAQGPDPKNKAVLRAIGRDGTLMAEYQAFDSNYGLTVSSGDLDGDWTDELVVGMGPDPKNPTMLKVLKYAGGTFSELTSVEVFESLKYGVNTAVGDVDGDNMPEIVTVPGPDPKNPAIVKVWEYDGQALNEVGQFHAFDTRYGATVATGDTDGDGVSEILVGTGPDPKNMAVVRIFEADGEFVGEYWPYGEDYGYGVNIAAVDLNGDGVDELVTGLGPGPQNQPWLKVITIDGSELASYLAYPENTKYGVRVCPARPGVAEGN